MDKSQKACNSRHVRGFLIVDKHGKTIHGVIDGGANTEKQSIVRAPLIEAMEAYHALDMAPYHTPGHKHGVTVHPSLRTMLTEKGLRMDVSLMSALDDLNDPEGCLLEAEQMAASLYGAEDAFFAVNGTTGAIHAMILATVRAGDKIIVPRTAHRSVIGGIILADAMPVWVRPEVDEALGLAHGTVPEAYLSAIEAYPDAKAVFVVNPTYYGACGDIKEIVRLAHEHGMAVLVDEAHGPHLVFADDLPMSAMEAGADLAAQSTHKLLPAMTQASLLLRQGELVSRERVLQMLQLTQSTSPNYILMASIDGARALMEEQGRPLMERTLRLARRLREEVNKIDGLFSFGRERIGTCGIYDLDETKVTVTVSGLGVTGAQAEAVLRRKGIEAELCDYHNVLFLITVGDTDASIDRLLAAIREMADELRTGAVLDDIACDEIGLPEVVTSPRQALYTEREKIDFVSSAGRIAAEVVTFYPPGIPVLCPGERITTEAIDYCQRRIDAGLFVSGPMDRSLRTILVEKERD